MNLKASYQFADRIMQQRATSFYVAFQDLSSSDFLSIAAIYAFCRYADDLADNSSPDTLPLTEKKLNALKQDILNLYDDKRDSKPKPTYPWWAAFEHTVKTRKIKPQPLLDQISGQECDISFKPLRSVEDLLWYSQKVAGSVGLMLAPMLRGEAADETFESVCESLGIAMQITNILRDVGEDLRDRKRIYLPAQIRKEYRITAQELYSLSTLPPLWRRVLPFRKNLKVPDNFILMWEELATLSEKYYQNFYQHLSMFSDHARLPVTAAAVFYEAILEEVRKNGYDCFRKRCYTDSKTKLLLLQEARNKVNAISL